MLLCRRKSGETTEQAGSLCNRAGNYGCAADRSDGSARTRARPKTGGRTNARGRRCCGRRSRTGDRRHRRAPCQSRHARCGDARGGAALSEGISQPTGASSKRTRCSGSSCSTASFCRSARGAKRATTGKSGIATRTNRRSRPSRVRKPKSSAASSNRSASMSLSTGRCATPIRRSRRGSKCLTTWGCDRILVMPLYPQYSAATTATVCDEVFRFLLRQRRQPAMRILPAYYDDPYYIEVLASSLKAELKALPFTPDVIIASYHGMPTGICAQGRSLRGAMRAHDGAVAPAAWLRRQQADDDVSVALRPRAMARALLRSIP